MGKQIVPLCDFLFLPMRSGSSATRGLAEIKMRDQLERLLVKIPAADLCLSSRFKIRYQIAYDELLQDPRWICLLEHQGI